MTSGKAAMRSKLVAPPSAPSPIHCRGFSMAETLVSVVLVGGVLVAALHTAGQSTVGQGRMVNRAKGNLLAHDLMAEILRQSYRDPGLNPIFGPEAIEATGSRAAYDDVDDYYGLQETTLQQKDGTAIPNATGWAREVDVVYVNPANLLQTTQTDEGIKRITVIVEYAGVPAASVTALRGAPGPTGSGGQVQTE